MIVHKTANTRVIFTNDKLILQEQVDPSSVSLYRNVASMSVNEIRDNEHLSELVNVLFNMAGIRGSMYDHS